VALPVPSAGRQGLVSFRVFGFPVSIHGSFLIIVLFFGLSGGGGVPSAVTWLVVVTVSVIAHELGHAAVAAPVGGDPHIDLYGMAGLTRWNPSRAGRGRRVAVSLAGPGAGVLLGLLVFATFAVLQPPEGGWLGNVLGDAIFVNVFWGLVNLLPMLPLDGGQVAYALMPGREDGTRLRRAAYLSIGVGVAVALALVAGGQPILAAFVVFFGAGNVQTLQALRRAERGDPLADRLRAAEEAVAERTPEEALRLLPDVSVVPPNAREAVTTLRAMALLRADQAREAQDALLTLPPGSRVEPAFEAAVLLANGQERLARERLAAALAAYPAEWAVRELTALLVRRGDDVDEVLAPLTGDALGGAVHALYHAERWADAARVGDRALTTGAQSPLVAYNTACSWARAGDADRALRALDLAALYGFADLANLDADTDLDLVRPLPGWAAVRDRVAANAGLGQPSRQG
jgi:Zn-dependent protease